MSTAPAEDSSRLLVAVKKNCRFKGSYALASFVQIWKPAPSFILSMCLTFFMPTDQSEEDGLFGR